MLSYESRTAGPSGPLPLATPIPRISPSYLLIKSSNHGLDPLHWFVSRHVRAEDTAALRWLIQGARPELTRLFPHENVPLADGRGTQGRVFFPFCRIHHATAMTHHRKSSSQKLVGGVEDQGEAGHTDTRHFLRRSSN